MGTMQPPEGTREGGPSKKAASIGESGLQATREKGKGVFRKRYLIYEGEGGGGVL